VLVIDEDQHLVGMYPNVSLFLLFLWKTGYYVPNTYRQEPPFIRHHD
jgi:hypothetical protein